MEFIKLIPDRLVSDIDTVLHVYLSNSTSLLLAN